MMNNHLPILSLSVVVITCLSVIYTLYPHDSDKKKYNFALWGGASLAILSLIVINKFEFDSHEKKASVNYWSSASSFLLTDDKLFLNFKNDFPALIGNIVYMIGHGIQQYELAHIQDLIEKNDLSKEAPLEIIGKDRDKIKNVVLVMGESSLSSYYTIYGYEKFNTTPRLQLLKDEGKICALKKAHSPAPTTRTSVPLNLTFTSPERFSEVFVKKSIVNLANENGYKTFWLATQNSGGISGYGSTYEFIARSASVWVSPDMKHPTYGVVPEDDDVMLTLIHNEFQDTAEYKFFILHLVGNHSPYNIRYKEQDKLALPDASDYARSIHKVDRILGGIIEAADKYLGEYALLYVSDHGEIVGKDHGLTLGGYDQYNIPFILKPVDKSDCDYVENKYRLKNGYISGLTTKYILSEYLGYSINSHVIDATRDLVLHADGIVYDYEKLPQSK